MDKTESMSIRLICFLCLCGVIPALQAKQPVRVSPQLPGVKVDGSILLPNQWSLRPSGRQVPLGDFPVNLAVHPSGKFVIALHAGDSAQELISVSLPTGQVIARAQLPETFYGVAFRPMGSGFMPAELEPRSFMNLPLIPANSGCIRKLPCGTLQPVVFRRGSQSARMVADYTPQMSTDRIWWLPT